MGIKSASLGYVALVVREIEPVANVFGGLLELPQVELRVGEGRAVSAFAAGETVLALFDPDDPFLGEDAQPGMHHLGVCADDPEGWLRRAGLGSNAAMNASSVNDAPQHWPDSVAVGGVRMRVGRPFDAVAAPPGRIERIDHIGVASADNADALRLFCDGMGFVLESQQTDIEVRTAVESFTSDKYGVVYHSRPPEPVGGLRVAFVTVGDCELEFLQDFDPGGEAAIDHGRPGNTKQDRSAIARFIERRGAGLHHLALKTGAIDETLGLLADAGLRMIDTAGRPGSRRARIGFMHPAALGGVLLHFVEREEF